MHTAEVEVGCKVAVQLLSREVAVLLGQGMVPLWYTGPGMGLMKGSPTVVVTIVVAVHDAGQACEGP